MLHSAGTRVTRGSFLDAIMGLSGSVLDANQQTEHYFRKAYGDISINVKVIF